MRTYGLTTEDYEEIYEYQGGRCYICQYATGRTRRLSVDHCHKTGLIRGLLCAPCNKMLGRFRDNPEAGTRIIEYLDRPPAVDAIGERFVP
jgi:Recombination endonuclease VII